MNIILIEDSRFSICPFLEKVHTKFPQSSRLTLNDRNFFDNNYLIKERPVLTNCWLVRVSPNLSIKQMAEIMKVNNLNIIHLSNLNKFDIIAQGLKDEDIEFSVVNNLKPSKEDLVNYVKTTLDIKKADAVYICNRHKYHLPTIVNSVSILSTFDKIDRNKIKEYTVRFSDVSLYTLIDYLLDLETKVTKQKIIEVVYSYKYGFEFLLSFIQKELSKYLCVYDYVGNGLLSLQNILDFEPSIEDNIYKTISHTQVKKIIEAYKTLSYEKLYYIKLQIDLMEPKQSNLYKLINLLGG